MPKSTAARYRVLRDMTTPIVLGSAEELCFSVGEVHDATDFPAHVRLADEVAAGVLEPVAAEEIA